MSGLETWLAFGFMLIAFSIVMCSGEALCDWLQRKYHKSFYGLFGTLVMIALAVLWFFSVWSDS